jgi:hypothetical protein
MAGRRPPRSILEEPGFTAGREAILPDVKRWDEFWRAVAWALAQDPAGFDQIPDHDLWVIVSESSRQGMPRIRTFYCFDDAHIYLKWVEKV